MPKGVHLNPRTGWHLPAALVERLKRYATRSGRTQVAVVSDALSEYLERHDAPTETEESGK